jgi:hypothetical protein
VTIVDSFDPGGLAQLGLPQACNPPTVFPLREFTVDEEPEAFLKGEGRDIGHLELLAEGLTHAMEAQGLQFVEGGMREH